jgi:hypothetical protein
MASVGVDDVSMVWMNVVLALLVEAEVIVLEEVR